MGLGLGWLLVVPRLHAQVTFALDSSRVVASTTRSVAAADVNGDGKVDLIYASFVPTDAPRIPGRLTVLLNNGNGTFSTSGDYAVGVLPWFVTSADVNGDGRPDLISANYRTSNGMSTLSLARHFKFPAGKTGHQNIR